MDMGSNLGGADLGGDEGRRWRGLDFREGVREG